MSMKDRVSLLPLLLGFVLIVLAYSADDLVGDEIRYAWFTHNLTQGYYSPGDQINLWNGPGYPFVLVPFVLLDLPWLAARLLNAFLLFLAILYFHSTLRLYVRKSLAMFLAYLLGVYPPLLRYLPLLLTEALAILLICGALFHFCRFHQQTDSRWRDLVVASLFLGYLCLTKIFYGYVISACLLCAFALYVWKRKPALGRAAIVCLLALVSCIPYLSYTYTLTGRVFYWGNSGGSALYWMSSPYEDESGTWFSDEEAIENPDLRGKHGEFFARLEQLSSIEKDDELKRQAFHNILHNPRKYMRNWIANVGRLIFNYPFDYTPQKPSTYLYILPNMFIAVFCVLMLYPAYRLRRLIPFEVWAGVLFAVISLAGASFLSGHSPRQSMLLAPMVVLWIAFTYTRVVRVELAQR